MDNFYTEFKSKILFFFFAIVSVAATGQTGNICDDAINLPVGLGNCSSINVSNVGASDSGVGEPECGDYQGGDIWLSVTVPPSGSVYIETSAGDGSITDTAMEIYEGGCDGLNPIVCDDDSGPGFFSFVSLTDRTPGEIILVRVWDLGNDDEGNFDICAVGEANCIFPAANFLVTTDCEQDQFTVEVDITDLGGAASLNITNNGGVGAITNITTTGIHIVGPFDLGQQVTLTVSNPDEEGCEIQSEILTNAICPQVVTCGNPLNLNYCYGNLDSSEFVYYSINNNVLSLNFSSGTIESCCDEIIIYDGDNTSADILYQGSGNLGDLSGVSVTSTSGAIMLKIDSDPSGSCSDPLIGSPFIYTVSCEGEFIDCSTATEVIPAPTFGESTQDHSLQDVFPSGIVQCNGESDAADQWFKYTAVASNMFIRAWGNGDFDAVIEVYENCNAAPVFCVNETGAGEKEIVIVPNQEVGVEYYYRVYHDGSASPSNMTYSTAVAHIPFVKLRDISCGIMDFDVFDVISSDVPSEAWLLEAYQFEFTELEEPFNTYEVVSPNGTNYNFLLNWFPQIQPGRTYSVRVRTLQYQGPTWGDYGEACTIGINGLSTALIASYENGVYDFCDLIQAEPAGQMTSNYRWVFSDGNNEIEYNSNSYNVILKNIPGLQYNTTYEIEVFATVNGTETVSSTPRSITIGGVPQTGVNNNISACGIVYPLNSVLYSHNVCKATTYEWRFTNTNGEQAPFTHSVFGGAYNLLLSTVSGLIPGDNYNVTVRAIHGGQTGTFGSACNITIFDDEEINGEPNSMMIGNAEKSVSEESLEVGLYPNPNNGSEVRLSIENLKSEGQQVDVEIFDIVGKRIMSYQIPYSGSNFNTVLRFDQQLRMGTYLVVVHASEFTMTKKLIVE